DSPSYVRAFVCRSGFITGDEKTLYRFPWTAMEAPDKIEPLGPLPRYGVCVDDRIWALENGEWLLIDLGQGRRTTFSWEERFCPGDCKLVPGRPEVVDLEMPGIPVYLLP